MKKGFGVNVAFYKKSFDECVLDPADPECLWVPGHDHFAKGEGGSHASQMMFFCGQKPHCRIINGERAFK